jgi:hypothetical protein
MSIEELQQLLDERTFSPFVLTTKDGFALPVTEARAVLIGLAMLAIKHQGRIYQIPFHAIAHISERGAQL